MKLKFNLIFIIIILLGFVFASKAGTFKPFIRSRYSLRWRKTTETPKILASSTITSNTKEETPAKTLLNLESSTENSIQVTTIKNLLKTSTHPPDYDYYNNEVEEAEHKS